MKVCKYLIPLFALIFSSYGFSNDALFEFGPFRISDSGTVGILDMKGVKISSDEKKKSRSFSLSQKYKNSTKM